jgi:phosphoglycerate dehydrogenase-like enzyme
MRWLHHTQAGVSNLWSSDVWDAAQVVITSGRGHVRPTAMAEYCIAAAMAFARSLHDGYLDKAGGKLDRGRYKPLRVAGATMGVVGMGGIGSEVARLSKALGMRVVATRRSVMAPQQNAEGADLLLPASELKQLAAESDFIAVCTQLTRETLNLLDAGFFAATTKQPVLANVSRGEVIDEDAMLAALDAGTLRGAVLDVFIGELDGRPPRPELLSHPNIILTPHVSAAGVSSDTAVIDLFCENLRRYLKGEDLLNVVDRARGY